MLEQPQTGLISRFFRQAENRLKKHINYKIENHNIQKLNFKNRGGSVLPYHTLHCMINLGNTLVETTTTTNNTQHTEMWYYNTILLIL